MLWKSLVTFSLLLAGSAVTAEKTAIEQTRYDDAVQNGVGSGGYSGGSGRNIGVDIGGGYDDIDGGSIDRRGGRDAGGQGGYSGGRSISRSNGYAGGGGFVGSFVSGSGSRYGNGRGGGFVSIKSKSRDRYGNVKVIHKSKSFRGNGFAGISIKHHGHHGIHHHKKHHHGHSSPWKRSHGSSIIRPKRSNLWIWKRSHPSRRTGGSRWGNYW